MGCADHEDPSDLYRHYNESASSRAIAGMAICYRNSSYPLPLVAFAFERGPALLLANALTSGADRVIRL